MSTAITEKILKNVAPTATECRNDNLSHDKGELSYNEFRDMTGKIGGETQKWGLNVEDNDWMI